MKTNKKLMLKEVLAKHARLDAEDVLEKMGIQVGDPDYDIEFRKLVTKYAKEAVGESLTPGLEMMQNPARGKISSRDIWEGMRLTDYRSGQIVSGFVGEYLGNAPEQEELRRTMVAQMRGAIMSMVDILMKTKYKDMMKLSSISGDDPFKIPSMGNLSPEQKLEENERVQKNYLKRIAIASILTSHLEKMFFSSKISANQMDKLLDSAMAQAGMVDTSGKVIPKSLKSQAKRKSISQMFYGQETKIVK